MTNVATGPVWRGKVKQAEALIAGTYVAGPHAPTCNPFSTPLTPAKMRGLGQISEARTGDGRVWHLVRHGP